MHFFYSLVGVENPVAETIKCTPGLRRMQVQIHFYLNKCKKTLTDGQRTQRRGRKAELHKLKYKLKNKQKAGEADNGRRKSGSDDSVDHDDDDELRQRQG